MQIRWSRCGVGKMRNGLVLGLALGLAVIAGPRAFAFQEQNGATAPPPAEAQPAPTPAPTDKALGVSDETAQVKTDAGTEIRIPGLGKLGVLPKMDFGLELLYGAAETKQPQSTPPEDETDDLQIRGTVKHRF